MRSALGYLHNAAVFGDCITADFFVFDKRSDDVGLEEDEQWISDTRRWDDLPLLCTYGLS